jgi:hypothetical protein
MAAIELAKTLQIYYIMLDPFVSIPIGSYFLVETASRLIWMWEDRKRRKAYEDRENTKTVGKTSETAGNKH